MCLQIDATGIAQDLSRVAVLPPEGRVSGKAVTAGSALLAWNSSRLLHVLATYTVHSLPCTPPQLATCGWQSFRLLSIDSL